MALDYARSLLTHYALLIPLIVTVGPQLAQEFTEYGEARSPVKSCRLDMRCSWARDAPEFGKIIIAVSRRQNTQQTRVRIGTRANRREWACHRQILPVPGGGSGFFSLSLLRGLPSPERFLLPICESSTVDPLFSLPSTCVAVGADPSEAADA